MRVDVAIIGTGNIGSHVARDLVTGGQPVILSARAISDADTLVASLGRLATAATVDEAINNADVILFAVQFYVTMSLITSYADSLAGKVVLDPSSAIRPDGMGGYARTLADGLSSGALIASMLPKTARFAKAFGTILPVALGEWSRRMPDRATLFYATDDELAAKTTEQLIISAGFDPVRAGGVDAAIRIEMFGDLHVLGGLDGRAVTATEARLLVRNHSKTPAP